MLSFWLGKYGLTSGQCCVGEAEAAGQPGERVEEKSAGKNMTKICTLIGMIQYYWLNVLFCMYSPVQFKAIKMITKGGRKY